jgi:hypothetical protein
MRLPPSLPFGTQEAPFPPATTHRWQHEVSRRAFIKTAAGTAALAYGSGLLRPLWAFADPPGTGTPQPIPGGAPELGGVYHVFLPAPGNEPSTITDLNGFVGLAVLQGHWTGPGATADSMWEADMRFMKGLFVGTDGRSREGTFGFV